MKKLLLLILSAISLVGCGSEGPSGGVAGGNTVLLSAEPTTNVSATAVFSNLSSAGFLVNDFNLTVSGYPNQPAGVVLSPVAIESVDVSYVSMDGSPAIPLVYNQPSSMIVNPGATDKIQVGVVDIPIRDYVFDNYSTRLKKGETFRYRANLTFNGTEVNTGTSMDASTSMEIYMVY